MYCRNKVAMVNAVIRRVYYATKDTISMLTKNKSSFNQDDPGLIVMIITIIAKLSVKPLSTINSSRRPPPSVGMEIQNASATTEVGNGKMNLVRGYKHKINVGKIQNKEARTIQSSFYQNRGVQNRRNG